MGRPGVGVGVGLGLGAGLTAFYPTTLLEILETHAGHTTFSIS